MRSILTVLALILPVSAAAAPSLSDASLLYSQNKVADAQKAFTAIAADPGANKDDRSAAERQLARIAWLVEGKADLALSHLANAAKFGGEPCATASYRGRVLRESARAVVALQEGPSLLAICEAGAERDSLRTRLIGARLDLAAGDTANRARLLAEAEAEAEKIDDRSDVEGARVRLETALLVGEAGKALAAWKDYFWLDEEDSPPALVPLGAGDRFRGGLKPDAPIADRLRLVDLLMRAGFGDQAWRYARSHNLAAHADSDPVWRKLQAYHDEIAKVRSVELMLNRGFAHGKRDDTMLENTVKAATMALMKAAGASGDPRQVLLDEYGIVGTVGKTSGYPSIHIGHLIEDHKGEVSQYGQSAPVRFQVIDNMIGNGFESWLWDGSAMVGGWAADGVIVHVRPGYVRSPMNAYRLTYDSPDRRRVLARQKARWASDIAALKARDIVTQESLGDRLQLQLVDQIWSAARSKAKTESDEKRLFLADYSRANLDQSITVHEGRHAIDNAMGLKDNVDQAVLEYQAKLAELALTAYPRMALANMNRNLEGDGPHDRAGARVFRDFKAWMEAHRGEVIGLDSNVPVVAQVDKLTDGQIREIATGLDPLSKGKAIASGDSQSGKSTTPRQDTAGRTGRSRRAPRRS